MSQFFTRILRITEARRILNQFAMMKKLKWGCFTGEDRERIKDADREEKTAILLVGWNVRLELQFSQRGYVLESGNLVLSGDSEQLLENSDVRKAYLGG